VEKEIEIRRYTRVVQQAPVFWIHEETVTPAQLSGSKVVQ